MKSKDRVLTSAIENMSVADVRKSLALIRKQWENHTSMNPIYLSKELNPDFSLSKFAYLFIMGHHHKRHNK